MRNSFTVTTGLKLSRSLSTRQQEGRRWALLAVAMLALAITGAALGLVTASGDTGEAAAPTGPFSYFPSA